MGRIAVRSACVIAATVLAAASPVFAERASDDVPLSNWAAPPYWVPPAPASRATESKRLEAPAVANPSLAFHAVTPCRVADTRGFGFTGPYGPPSLVAGSARSFAVTSPGTACGIPSGVAAVSFNFAVANLAANGNLVVFPTGAPTPTVSSLNWTPSELAISNAAVVALGADSVNVLVNGPGGSTVDLIIDVNGYYAADPVVSSLNTLSGALSLVPVGDITVTSASPNINIGTNATSGNTANTIVRRNASGAFSAGTITGTLNGNATGFTGSLAGDVTGSQGATVVASVGGSSASNVHAAEQLANAATSAETANAIVRRDASADVQVHRIAASGGYTQPGTGGEPLKIIRGLFFCNPINILTGTGFTAVRNSVGSYTLTWSTAFSAIPSLQAMIGATTGNAYLNSASNGAFTIVTRDNAGNLFDPASISFIAIGPP